MSLEVAGGQITSIKSVVNPDKLAHLGPVADFAALLRSAG
jgi:RNA polymerase sigma-70 factor (ECF subfamily)